MLARLADEDIEVLVVGGGATGLGCAVDAASRGYRTALLEASDFAKGTSSRSTFSEASRWPAVPMRICAFRDPSIMSCS